MAGKYSLNKDKGGNVSKGSKEKPKEKSFLGINLPKLPFGGPDLPAIGVTTDKHNPLTQVEDLVTGFPAGLARLGAGLAKENLSPAGLRASAQGFANEGISGFKKASPTTAALIGSPIRTAKTLNPYDLAYTGGTKGFGKTELGKRVAEEGVLGTGLATVSDLSLLAGGVGVAGKAVGLGGLSKAANLERAAAASTKAAGLGRKATLADVIKAGDEALTAGRTGEAAELGKVAAQLDEASKLRAKGTTGEKVVEQAQNVSRLGAELGNIPAKPYQLLGKGLAKGPSAIGAGVEAAVGRGLPGTKIAEKAVSGVSNVVKYAGDKAKVADLYYRNVTAPTQEALYRRLERGEAVDAIRADLTQRFPGSEQVFTKIMDDLNKRVEGVNATRPRGVADKLDAASAEIWSKSPQDWQADLDAATVKLDAAKAKRTELPDGDAGYKGANKAVTEAKKEVDRINAMRKMSMQPVPETLPVTSAKNLSADELRKIVQDTPANLELGMFDNLSRWFPEKGSPGVAKTEGPGAVFFTSRNAGGSLQGVLKVSIDKTGAPTSLTVGVAKNAQRQGVATSLYSAAEKSGIPVESVVGKTSLTKEGASFALGRRGESTAVDDAVLAADTPGGPSFEEMDKFNKENIRATRAEFHNQIQETFAPGLTAEGVVPQLQLPAGHGIDLGEALKSRGYTAWDPMTGMELKAKQIKPTSAVIPNQTFDEIARYSKYNAFDKSSSKLLQAYDSATGKWKHTVLALSPRWHVGNILGNVAMAAAAGVSPIEVITLGPKAWGMVKEGTAPAELLASGFHFSEEAFRSITQEPLSGAKQMARHPIQASYQMNQFVDDVNRTMVFLSKQKQGMSDRAAIQSSLKAAGDFSRMTPVERNVLRRTMPFYAWQKHITKLTFRLPLEDPARVAWTLHLADMGERTNPDAGAEGFNRNSIPIPGGNRLSLDPLNPFSSSIGMGLGKDAVTRASNPVLGGLLAAVTGASTKRGLEGVTMPEREFGDSPKPLVAEPNELVNFLMQQVPWTRQLQDAAAGTTKTRFDTGQEMPTQYPDDAQGRMQQLLRFAGVNVRPDLQGEPSQKVTKEKPGRKASTTGKYKLNK